jgi:hypothetical protein
LHNIAGFALRVLPVFVATLAENGVFSVHCRSRVFALGLFELCRNEVIPAMALCHKFVLKAVLLQRHLDA